MAIQFWTFTYKCNVKQWREKTTRKILLMKSASRITVLGCWPKNWPDQQLLTADNNRDRVWHSVVAISRIIVINRELPVWRRRRSVWSRDCDHVTDAVWLLLLVLMRHHTGLPEGSVLRREFGLTAPATHRSHQNDVLSLKNRRMTNWTCRYI